MKYLINYSVLLLLLFVVSCTVNIETKENKPELTPNEDRAFRAVGKYFGGYAKWKKGEDKQNGKKISYFEIQLSKSNLIEDQYANFLKMPGSNMALIFYNNLGNDRSKFTHIRVQITLKNGVKHQYQYSMKELETAAIIEEVFHEAADELRSLEYQKFTARFDSIRYPDIGRDIETLYSKIDSAYAPSTKVELTGFDFHPPDPSAGNVTLAVAAGAICFPKENVPITFFIRADDGMMEGMKFEW